MSLLRNGITDVNTEDPAEIQRREGRVAGADQRPRTHDSRSTASTRRCPRTSSGSAARGRATSSRRHVLPAARRAGIGAGLLVPADGWRHDRQRSHGAAADWEVPRLAHEFLNFFLDKTNSYNNFIHFNGYQTPMTSIEPSALVPDVISPFAERSRGRPRSTSTTGGSCSSSRRTVRLSGTPHGTRSRPVASQTAAPEKPSVERPKAPRVERNTGIHFPRLVLARFRRARDDLAARLFVLPFYVVVSVAFGTIDPFFQNPLPVYQPWWWSGSDVHRHTSDVSRPRVMPASIGRRSSGRSSTSPSRAHLPGARVRGRVLRRPVRGQSARACSSSC